MYVAAASKAVRAESAAKSFFKCAIWCRVFYAEYVRAKEGGNLLFAFCNELAQAEDAGPLIQVSEITESGDLHTFVRVICNSLKALYMLDANRVTEGTCQLLMDAMFVSVFAAHGPVIPGGIAVEGPHDDPAILAGACQYAVLLLNLSPPDVAALIKSKATRWFVSARTNGDFYRDAARAAVTFLALCDAKQRDPVATARAEIAKKQKLKGDQLTNEIFRRAQALNRQGLDAWQTLPRALRVEFGSSPKQLEATLNARRKQLKTDILKATMRSARADLEKKLALADAILGRPKLRGDVTQADVENLLDLVRGLEDYSADHAIKMSERSLHGYLKHTHKFTTIRQYQILCSDLVGSHSWANANAKFIESFRKFLRSYTETKKQACCNVGDIGTNWHIVPRWIVGLSRATTAQALGRGVVAAVTPIVLAAALTSWEPAMGMCIVVCLADLSLKAAAAYRSAKLHQAVSSTFPENPRRVSVALTTAAISVSVLTPVLAGGMLLYSVPDEEQHGTPAQQVDKLVTSYGMALYLIKEIGGSTWARIIRQLAQTLTTSNLSAGKVATYLDNSPLSDNDKEYANALRDLLYVVTTAGTAIPSYLYGTQYSAIYLPIILSSINEGLDEINPDFAVYLLKFIRDRLGRYEDTGGRIKIADGTSPSVFGEGSLDFAEHFLDHSAARITHFAIGDAFSLAADILGKNSHTDAALRLKVAGIVINGLFGARRGAMVSYLQAGKAIPSGLLTLILRKITFNYFLEASSKLQARPVLKNEVQVLDVREGYKFDRPKTDWNWRHCWNLSMDGKLLAICHGDYKEFFHQAELEAVTIAVFNMMKVDADRRELLHLVCAKTVKGSKQDRSFAELAAEFTESKASDLRGPLERATRAASFPCICAELKIASNETWAGIFPFLKPLQFVRGVAVSFTRSNEKAREAFYLRCCASGVVEIYSPKTDHPLVGCWPAGQSLCDGMSEFLAAVHAPSKIQIAYVEPFGGDDILIPMQDTGSAATASSDSVSSGGSTYSSNVSSSASPNPVQQPQPPKQPPKSKVQETQDDFGLSTAVPPGKKDIYWAYCATDQKPDPQLAAANMLIMYLKANDAGCMLKTRKGVPTIGADRFAILQAIGKSADKVALTAATLNLKGGQWLSDRATGDPCGHNALVIWLETAQGRHFDKCILLAESRRRAKFFLAIDPMDDQVELIQAPDIRCALSDYLAERAVGTQVHLLYPSPAGSPTKGLSLALDDSLRIHECTKTRPIKPVWTVVDPAKTRRPGCGGVAPRGQAGKDLIYWELQVNAECGIHSANAMLAYLLGDKFKPITPKDVDAFSRHWDTLTGRKPEARAYFPLGEIKLFLDSEADVYPPFVSIEVAKGTHWTAKCIFSEYDDVDVMAITYPTSPHDPTRARPLDHTLVIARDKKDRTWFYLIDSNSKNCKELRIPSGSMRDAVGAFIDSCEYNEHFELLYPQKSHPDLVDLMKAVALKALDQKGQPLPDQATLAQDVADVLKLKAFQKQCEDLLRLAREGFSLIPLQFAPLRKSDPKRNLTLVDTVQSAFLLAVEARYDAGVVIPRCIRQFISEVRIVADERVVSNPGGQPSGEVKGKPADPWDLQRFIDQHDEASDTDPKQTCYQVALAELGMGQKKTDWIWYIFPQLPFGSSAMSTKFSIAGSEEAMAYLANDILRDRLFECCTMLVNTKGKSALKVFGKDIDVDKLRSSMTLFAAVSVAAAKVPGKGKEKEERSIFDHVLDHFSLDRDQATLLQLKKTSQKQGQAAT